MPSISWRRPKCRCDSKPRRTPSDQGGTAALQESLWPRKRATANQWRSRVGATGTAAGRWSAGGSCGPVPPSNGHPRSGRTPAAPCSPLRPLDQTAPSPSLARAPTRTPEAPVRLAAPHPVSRRGPGGGSAGRRRRDAALLSRLPMGPQRDADDAEGIAAMDEPFPEGEAARARDAAATPRDRVFGRIMPILVGIGVVLTVLGMILNRRAQGRALAPVLVARSRAGDRRDDVGRYAGSGGHAEVRSTMNSGSGDDAVPSVGCWRHRGA